MGTHFLDRLFAPETIAVFGANERTDSIAGRVYDNLRQGGFAGSIYAVNPKHEQIYGQPCYKSLQAIGKPVDLAVIATPAKTIPKIISACGERGVRAAIVISTGFNDSDKRGSKLKKALLKAAKAHQVRILGPNCLGLIRPRAGMNASFSKNTARPGQLALISQSGAICTSILDWAGSQDIGFSAIISLGNAADIGFGDLLDYLAQDPETQSILLYVEGIRNARSFLSGLRIAARMKPVILIKAGRHVEGSRAATTHSGAMIGADDVFDAALQRAGVVRVMTIEQLFSTARLLASRNRVNGNRLAIVTNGGGLGVMATDRAIDLGVEIASLADDSITRLGACLPPHWSCTNPVDLLGDADESRYQSAVDICLDDAGVDGVLAMLSPQAMTEPLACAQAMINARNVNGKPLLACWMGKQQVESANTLFAKHNLPSFPNPESAVEAFAYIASHYENQQLLKQIPGPLAKNSEPDLDGAKLIIQKVLAERRNLLSAAESKALLECFNVPINKSIACHSLDEALLAAKSTGFPVAMKIDSRDISHKSDVGGIKLGIRDAASLRSSYREMLAEVAEHKPDARIDGVAIEAMHTFPQGRELLIGVISDPVFGPAITFGAGGIQVEILRDRAVALPPLNRFLIEKMISQTQVAGLLGKFRNMPAIRMEDLIQVLRRVSEMVCELPEIRALDINPLIADDSGVMALDARVEIEQPAPGRRRYQHMAIHPYPAHLVSTCQLADGSSITIRPIRPEDAAIEQSFVRSLSSESRHFRFMHGLNELTQPMLVRFTQLDYDRELALIAVQEHTEVETELGVARYVMNTDGESCEFALVVADEWQHRGIGTGLMRALIEAARQRGFKRIEGEILTENTNMRALVEKLGFHVDSNPEERTIVLAAKLL
jgi:acetyltransferase